MIYIVHGNDYAKSRKLIINQKEKFEAEHITEKDIEEIEPKELYETLISFDLFGKPPFIILKVPTSNMSNIENFISVMEKTPEESVLIILCPQKMSRTNKILSAAKKLKAKVALNEKVVESNIFDLVDNLYLKNRRGTYTELEKLEKDELDPFYIFSMLLYGLRAITHAKFESESFLKKSPFIKDKTGRQAENFSEQEIMNLFDFFYETDLNLKTGKIDKNIVIPYTIEKILNL